MLALLLLEVPPSSKSLLNGPDSSAPLTTGASALLAPGYQLCWRTRLP